MGERDKAINPWEPRREAALRSAAEEASRVGGEGKWHLSTILEAFATLDAARASQTHDPCAEAYEDIARQLADAQADLRYSRQHVHDMDQKMSRLQSERDAALTRATTAERDSAQWRKLLTEAVEVQDVFQRERDAAEQDAERLRGLLSEARCWVRYCDGLQVEAFGKSLLPEIDAALAPSVTPPYRPCTLNNPYTCPMGVEHTHPPSATSEGENG